MSIDIEPTVTEGENRVLVDTATRAVVPTAVESGAVYSLVVPDNAARELIDTEYLLDEPRRQRGTVTLHDAVSFVDFVKEHEGPASKVYASLPSFRLVAALNDSHAATSGTVPGWGDWRASLTLTKTPEWSHWESKNGQMLSQGQFAEHIEDGLDEIVEPGRRRDVGAGADLPCQHGRGVQVVHHPGVGAAPAPLRGDDDRQGWADG